MPVITISVAGKLPTDTKRELISGLTETAARITGRKKDSFTVNILELDHENIGVGGNMLADRRKKE